MSDLTTSLILSLKNSQFTRGLRTSSNDVDRFTTTSSRNLRKLRGEFEHLTGNVLGRFKGELLAIGATWGGIQQLKGTGQLNKDLTRMSQTAGVARSETAGLRKELFALQRQYGVVVDSSRRANDDLLQSGLNWAEALQSTKAIAPASAVTGARSDVLASALSTSAEIYGFDLAQVGVATEILGKMTFAGRAGKAELEDLASIFARVGVNARTANLDFEQTLGFIEQLSKYEKNPERLATLGESTLRIFTNQKYQQKVTEQIGVSFYDKQGARRDSLAVIDDISKLYKQQKTDLQRDTLIALAFGETDLDTQRGIRSLLNGDAVAGVREITEGTRNGADVVIKDINDALDNSIDQTARLRGALAEAADAFAQPIDNAISRIIKYTLDSKEQGGLGLDGTDLLLGGAAAVGAGALGYKFGGAGIRALLGKGGRLAGGVAAGKALEAAAGVTPVYVVNMPAGFGGGPGSVVDDVLDLGRRAGRGRGGVRGLPRLPGPGGYTALPGSSSMDMLKTFGLRGVLNDYAAHGVGRLLGGIGLNASVLAGGVGSTGLMSLLSGVGIAGATGYGLGTLFHKYALEGTETEMDIGRTMAKVAAFFGSDNAQAALDAEQRVREQKAQEAEELAKAQETGQQAQASVKVLVQDDRIKVTQVTATGMDLDVSGGLSMGTL